MQTATEITRTTIDPRMAVGAYYAVLQSCRIRSRALAAATGRSLESTDREVVGAEAARRHLTPASVAAILEDLSLGL